MFKTIHLYHSHTYIYIHILHIYTHIFVYTYVYIYIYIYLYAYLNIHLWIRSYNSGWDVATWRDSSVEYSGCYVKPLNDYQKMKLAPSGWLVLNMTTYSDSSEWLTPPISNPICGCETHVIPLHSERGPCQMWTCHRKRLSASRWHKGRRTRNQSSHAAITLNCWIVAIYPCKPATSDWPHPSAFWHFHSLPLLESHAKCKVESDLWKLAERCSLFWGLVIVNHWEAT